MLGEEDKNAALNDKKKRMWVHKCFRNRKSEREYWTLFKELADDEMKFYQYFIMSKHQFNYLLQKILKDLKKIPPSEKQETSNLSMVSTLQVNVILLRNIYWSYTNTLNAARNNRKFITYLIQK